MRLIYIIPKISSNSKIQSWGKTWFNFEFHIHMFLLLQSLFSQPFRPPCPPRACMSTTHLSAFVYTLLLLLRMIFPGFTPKHSGSSHNRQIKNHHLWGALPTSQSRMANSTFMWSVQFSSFQSLSHVRLFVTPRTAATPGAYPNSCPLSQWCHPTISSSVVPLSSCPQSFPASGSFPMSQFLTSGGQSIGVSASTSVIPMNTQDWSPLGWTGWISLQSKGLSRVFSNTTVQKH